MKVVVALLLVATLALSGCQSKELESRTYVKTGHDISSLKRYTWDNKEPLVNLGVLFGTDQKQLESVLKSNAVTALAKLGYQYVEADENPQFLVSMVAGAAERAQDSQHAFQKNEINLNRTMYWSQTNEYMHGGISLVIKDLSAENILWQGTATQRIKNHEMKKTDGSVAMKLLDVIVKDLPVSQS